MAAATAVPPTMATLQTALGCPIPSASATVDAEVPLGATWAFADMLARHLDTIGGHLITGTIPISVMLPSDNYPATAMGSNTSDLRRNTSNSNTTTPASLSLGESHTLSITSYNNTQNMNNNNVNMTGAGSSSGGINKATIEGVKTSLDCIHKVWEDLTGLSQRLRTCAVQHLEGEMNQQKERRDKAAALVGIYGGPSLNVGIRSSNSVGGVAPHLASSALSIQSHETMTNATTTPSHPKKNTTSIVTNSNTLSSSPPQQQTCQNDNAITNPFGMNSPLAETVVSEDGNDVNHIIPNHDADNNLLMNTQREYAALMNFYSDVMLMGDTLRSPDATPRPTPRPTVALATTPQAAVALEAAEEANSNNGVHTIASMAMNDHTLTPEAVVTALNGGGGGGGGVPITAVIRAADISIQHVVSPSSTPPPSSIVVVPPPAAGPIANSIANARKPRHISSIASLHASIVQYEGFRQATRAAVHQCQQGGGVEGVEGGMALWMPVSSVLTSGGVNGPLVPPLGGGGFFISPTQQYQPQPQQRTVASLLDQRSNIANTMGSLRQQNHHNGTLANLRSTLHKTSMSNSNLPTANTAAASTLGGKRVSGAHQNSVAQHSSIAVGQSQHSSAFNITLTKADGVFGNIPMLSVEGVSGGNSPQANSIEPPDAAAAAGATNTLVTSGTTSPSTTALPKWDKPSSAGSNRNNSNGAAPAGPIPSLPSGRTDTFNNTTLGVAAGTLQSIPSNLLSPHGSRLNVTTSALSNVASQANLLAASGIAGGLQSSTSLLSGAWVQQHQHSKKERIHGIEMEENTSVAEWLNENFTQESDKRRKAKTQLTPSGETNTFNANGGNSFNPLGGVGAVIVDDEHDDDDDEFPIEGSLARFDGPPPTSFALTHGNASSSGGNSPGAAFIPSPQKQGSTNNNNNPAMLASGSGRELNVEGGEWVSDSDEVSEGTERRRASSDSRGGDTSVDNGSPNSKEDGGAGDKNSIGGANVNHYARKAIDDRDGLMSEASVRQLLQQFRIPYLDVDSPDFDIFSEIELLEKEQKRKNDKQSEKDNKPKANTNGGNSSTSVFPSAAAAAAGASRDRQTSNADLRGTVTSLGVPDLQSMGASVNDTSVREESRDNTTHNNNNNTVGNTNPTTADANASATPPSPQTTMAGGGIRRGRKRTETLHGAALAGKLQRKPENIFVFVCMNVILRYVFVNTFCINIRKLIQYLLVIQSLYRDENPYHNAIHAADVLQTTHIYLTSNGVHHNFSDLEIFCLVFSALVHDVGHLGVNNTFLIRTHHPIAVLYNDKSPLENMHTSIALHLLNLSEYNFLSDGGQWSDDMDADFRHLVTDIISGTDMKFHASIIANVNDILADGVIEDEEISMLMKAIVHAADLSNPMKPKHLYLNWMRRINEEFWLQGDEEAAAGLPISVMCDRKTTKLPESQVGFINFIVKPFVQAFAVLLPDVWVARLDENLNYMMQMVAKNKQLAVAKQQEQEQQQRSAQLTPQQAGLPPRPPQSPAPAASSASTDPHENTAGPSDAPPLPFAFPTDSGGNGGQGHGHSPALVTSGEYEMADEGEQPTNATIASTAGRRNSTTQNNQVSSNSKNSEAINAIMGHQHGGDGGMPPGMAARAARRESVCWQSPDGAMIEMDTETGEVLNSRGPFGGGGGSHGNAGGGEGTTNSKRLSRTNSIASLGSKRNLLAVTRTNSINSREQHHQPNQNSPNNNNHNSSVVSSDRATRASSNGSTATAIPTTFADRVAEVNEVKMAAAATSTDGTAPSPSTSPSTSPTTVSAGGLKKGRSVMIAEEKNTITDLSSTDAASSAAPTTTTSRGGSYEASTETAVVAAAMGGFVAFGGVADADDNDGAQTVRNAATPPPQPAAAPSRPATVPLVSLVSEEVASHSVTDVANGGGHKNATTAQKDAAEAEREEQERISRYSTRDLITFEDLIFSNTDRGGGVHSAKFLKFLCLPKPIDRWVDTFVPFNAIIQPTTSTALNPPPQPFIPSAPSVNYHQNPFLLSSDTTHTNPSVIAAAESSQSSKLFINPAAGVAGGGGGGGGGAANPLSSTSPNVIPLLGASSTGNPMAGIVGGGGGGGGLTVMGSGITRGGSTASSNNNNASTTNITTVPPSAGNTVSVQGVEGLKLPCVQSVLAQMTNIRLKLPASSLASQDISGLIGAPSPAVSFFGGDQRAALQSNSANNHLVMMTAAASPSPAAVVIAAMQFAATPPPPPLNLRGVGSISGLQDTMAVNSTSGSTTTTTTATATAPTTAAEATAAPNVARSSSVGTQTSVSLVEVDGDEDGGGEEEGKSKQKHAKSSSDDVTLPPDSARSHQCQAMNTSSSSAVPLLTVSGVGADGVAVGAATAAAHSLASVPPSPLAGGLGASSTSHHNNTTALNHHHAAAAMSSVNSFLSSYNGGGGGSGGGGGGGLTPFGWAGGLGLGFARHTSSRSDTATTHYTASAAGSERDLSLLTRTATPAPYYPLVTHRSVGGAFNKSMTTTSSSSEGGGAMGSLMNMTTTPPMRTADGSVSSNSAVVGPSLSRNPPDHLNATQQPKNNAQQLSSCALPLLSFSPSPSSTPSSSWHHLHSNTIVAWYLEYLLPLLARKVTNKGDGKPLPPPSAGGKGEGKKVVRTASVGSNSSSNNADRHTCNHISDSKRSAADTQFAMSVLRFWLPYVTHPLLELLPSHWASPSPCAALPTPRALSPTQPPLFAAEARAIVKGYHDALSAVLSERNQMATEDDEVVRCRADVSSPSSAAAAAAAAFDIPLMATTDGTASTMMTPATALTVLPPCEEGEEGAAKKEETMAANEAALSEGSSSVRRTSSTNPAPTQRAATTTTTTTSGAIIVEEEIARILQTFLAAIEPYAYDLMCAIGAELASSAPSIATTTTTRTAASSNPNSNNAIDEPSLPSASQSPLPLLKHILGLSVGLWQCIETPREGHADRDHHEHNVHADGHHAAAAPFLPPSSTSSSVQNAAVTIASGGRNHSASSLVATPVEATVSTAVLFPYPAGPQSRRLSGVCLVNFVAGSGSVGGGGGGGGGCMLPGRPHALPPLLSSASAADAASSPLSQQQQLSVSSASLPVSGVVVGGGTSGGARTPSATQSAAVGGGSAIVGGSSVSPQHQSKRVVGGGGGNSAHHSRSPSANHAKYIFMGRNIILGGHGINNIKSTVDGSEGGAVAVAVGSADRHESQTASTSHSLPPPSTTLSSSSTALSASPTAAAGTPARVLRPLRYQHLWSNDTAPSSAASVVPPAPSNHHNSNHVGDAPPPPPPM